MDLEAVKPPKDAEYYIFDANFFITIQQINIIDFFKHFLQAKSKLNWNFYISDQVFKEIKGIYYSSEKSKIFQKCVSIIPVDNGKIQKLKEKAPNIHQLPQNPDLSLIILANKLKSPKTMGYLVTDDFKLNEFAEKNKIKVLSCSAFILKVAYNLQDRLLKRYFLKLRRQVQKAEIEYVLERKDIYPPHQKLSWLIERAINVSEEKVTFQEEVTEKFDEDNVEERIQQEIWLAKRVLLGEKLSKRQGEAIEYFRPLLDKVKEQLRLLRKAQRLISQNQTFQAIELLKEVERILTNLYFSEKAKFIPYNAPEILLAEILARANFLHALNSLQIGGIPEAKRFFDNTVMFGLIAKKQSLVLMAMLLTALIFVFSNRWKEAIEQYNLVIEVAKDFNDEQIWLKGLLGQSIVQFLSGSYRDAISNLDSIRDLLEKNPQKSPLILEEFGDIFYALGMADYALTIYREALEYQLELGRKEIPNHLIEKIRKCFLIQGIREPKTTKEFSEFMDAIHYLDGKYFDQYDEIMAKIFEINKLLYEPFPVFTSEFRKLSSLQIEGIKEWFDIIDIETANENKIILIAYSPKLGLFGIELLESSIAIPIPENYMVKFKENCEIFIKQPTPQQQEKYLIRAMIQVETDLELEIKRTMPSFYEILLKS
ncbi:MAG: tetratricopeptide repeat protein [Candidatus Helarchaeota archaeon]